MTDIRNVKLELLRSGPAHNQLLSPLTPYLALCGADGPVTVNMPFEHRQLLTRLDRLRYAINGSDIAASQREAELREMGEAIGRVLGEMPALLSELSNARSEGGKLVHLRLSLSAFELGLLPFEAAIAPDGFPGSGSPLFLQSRTPITITREIRRGQPLPIQWNRKPRILFAFATPDGLPPVPAQEHLQAIRRALDPWVKIKDKTEDRLKDVKATLTVMPDASLEKIRESCASTQYTHVHILAHGAPFDQARDRRYGIALCSDTQQANGDVVDGERLAIALSAWDSSGRAKYRPTVVTLATCDSGNTNSVLTPGGSIAHELHAAGIPWVIASQFPLWMRASSIAAEVLYVGLLSGADPRWVLFELRQRLRADSPGTHDWASIVAYATVPWDFERQVDAFRDQQVRQKLNVKFDRIDELVGANEEDQSKRPSRDKTAVESELDALSDSIRADLAAWRDEPAAKDNVKEKAERIGMSGASEKRIAIAYMLANKVEASKKAYEKSRDLYRAALELEPFNHWVITQYLSMNATPILAHASDALKGLAKQYGPWWTRAQQIAEWQLGNANDTDRVWAFGTLAELVLLGAAYGGTKFNGRRAEEEIVRYCKQMRKLCGQDRFPIFSTQRQFRRYIQYWNRNEWAGLARAALKALEGDTQAYSR
jgi:hypothetical protein